MGVNKKKQLKGEIEFTYLVNFIHLIENMKPSCLQEEAVVKFWEDLPEWISVGVEIKMYHKILCFPGTADIYYLILKIKNTL
jgi:hypothetical protein